MTDRALIEALLSRSGLGPAARIEALHGHGGTTSRLYRIRITDGSLVAKIADDPAILERACREVLVRRHLVEPLSAIAPRVVADRLECSDELPPSRLRAAMLMEDILEPRLDPAEGVEQEVLERIADAMSSAWSTRPDGPLRSTLDLPRWGAGTGHADELHRRRRDRFRRRAERTLELHAERATDLEEVLLETVNRFERLAGTAAGLETTLVHGDLHLGNVHGGRTAGESVRVLDWQHASLGPPVVDLARLLLDGARHPDFEAAVALAARLPVSTTPADLATSLLLAFSGFVVGMLGRPPESLGDAERAVVERFLLTPSSRTLLRTALRIEAWSEDARTGPGA